MTWGDRIIHKYPAHHATLQHIKLPSGRFLGIPIVRPRAFEGKNLKTAEHLNWDKNWGLLLTVDEVSSVGDLQDFIVV